MFFIISRENLFIIATRQRREEPLKPANQQTSQCAKNSEAAMKAYFNILSASQTWLAPQTAALKSLLEPKIKLAFSS